MSLSTPAVRLQSVLSGAPIAKISIMPDVVSQLRDAVRPLVENSRFKLFLPEMGLHTDFVAKCVFKTPKGEFQTKACTARVGVPRLSALSDDYNNIITFISPEGRVVHTAMFKPRELTPYLCGALTPATKSDKLAKTLNHASAFEVPNTTIAEVAAFLAKHLNTNPRQFPTRLNPFVSRYDGLF